MPMLRRLAVPYGTIVQRFPAAHAERLLAAWDFTGIAITGFACRSLNPSGHAGHTLREIVVVLATGLLGVALLRLRGSYGAAGGGRPALLFALMQTFALMLLGLLTWDELWLWNHGLGTDSILVQNRTWLFAWTLTAPALLLLTRPRLEASLRRAVPPAPRRRAILLGDAAGATRLGRVLAGRGAVEICGFFEIGSATGGVADGSAADDWPRLASLRDARAVLAHGEADLLLIALPEHASRRIAAVERMMAGVAADIWLAPDAARFYAADARVSALGGLPFLHLRERPLAGLAACIKRAEDLTLGLPLLLAALPAMLLIALAVRLSSPGPAFFIQPRLGLNRRIIRVRKFRTMRVETADSAGIRQTIAGDARVTPLGRALRRLSLDELPQLINVVEGSMSLVGPRPHALGTEAAGLPFGEAAAGYARAIA